MKRIFTQPTIVLLTIVLVAVFLRFYNIAAIPPALYSDEAIEGYDAARIVYTGDLRIFFAGNNGREPLMVYLQAIGVLLFGARAWTLHLVPAIVGLLAVPVIYSLARELFRGEKRATWLGVLAAGMLAVSFWDLSLSRFSVRAISHLLFSTITIWAFWRARQSLHLADFALSGVLLGLTLYTHIPSRLLPFVLLSFLIFVSVLYCFRPTPEFKKNYRRLWLGAAILFACMLVVFAPLGMYFVDNPGAFLQRTGTTSIFSGGWDVTLGNFGNNAVKVMRMFIDQGDLNPRHNIPGRPALEWLTAIGFWIGIVIAFLRITTKPVYVLLLLWLGANLAMTLFSTDAPHFHRSLGAMPAIVLLAADGLMQLRDRFLPRLSAPALVAIVVIAGGIQTYRDYFDAWGPNRETFFLFDGQTNALIDRALETSQTSDVMIPLRVFTTSQMQFALHPRFPQGIPTMPRTPQSSIWFLTETVQRTNIVLGKDGVFVPQPLDDAQIARLKELGKTGQRLDSQVGVLGVTQVYLENAHEFITPIHPARTFDANFGDQLRMIGYTIEPTTIKPGEKVRFTYFWQTMQTLNFDFVVSTNMLNPRGESFAQRKAQPVLDEAQTSLWQRGMIVPDAFDITVPADAPAGKYRIEVSLLNPNIADLLVPLAGVEDRLSLDPLTVTDTPLDLNAIANRVELSLGEPVAITLLGFDLGQPAHVGEKWNVTLFWRADRAVAKDYSVFVHLVDVTGNLSAQQDGAPQNGNAPTSWWRPGDLFADTYQLTIPADLPTGNYLLEIGVYDPSDGTRLPLFDSTGKRQPEDRWQIVSAVIR